MTMTILKSSLQKLVNAHTLPEATDIINQEKLDTIFDLAGTLKAFKIIEDVVNAVQKTVNWYVLLRAQPAYDAFNEGLSASRVFESMKKHPHVYKEAFCYKPQTLTANDLGQLFTTTTEDKGSNTREVVVLSHWHDFVQDCKEEGDVTLHEILFLFLGAEKYHKVYR